MNEPGERRGVDVTGSGGVRLAVRVHDAPSTSAPGLLLHHGLASSQRIWDLMLPRLTRRFRVVTYDARGHGVSAKPSSGYGFDSVVADARAVISSVALRRPIVVGHSWGAMVALELAARWPRVVEGAVLVDGGIGTLRGEMDWATAKQRLAPPHLAGMPVEEFRRMIRTFLGEAVEVTPQIEEIVVSVMNVDRNGRIKPRLSRREPLPDPPGDLAPRPRCGARTPLRPHPCDPRSRRRRPRVGRAQAPLGRAGGELGRAGPHLMDEGDPRSPGATSGRTRRADRTFLGLARTMNPWPGYS